ncbi:MAG: helicase-related protein [Chrysiogenales bacterium]
MSTADLQLALRNHFGFPAFRPGQQAAIECILAHRDTLVVMPTGAGIIYTGTRRDAEEVAEFIREIMGLKAKHYHGLVDSDLRNRIQDEFMTGDLQIMVATNAFGMGIDRPDVRFVLQRGGAASLVMLTLTKTIHSTG